MAIPITRIRERVMKTFRKIKLWLKVRIIYLLALGKCWRCKGKLHLNALGFYNCGKCFIEFMSKELGENLEDY